LKLGDVATLPDPTCSR